MLGVPDPLLIIAGVYLLMSLVSMATYAHDKRAAKRGRRRTPEGRLLTIDLLGGWPGGLIAQGLFRHKRRKLSYMLRFWGVVALHAIAWGAWLWLRSRGG